MDINSEVIELPTSDKSFFRDYLKLKKPLLEFILSKVNNKDIVLNPKLMDVLALLLYYNNKYKEMEDNMKWSMVFDSVTKEEIVKELGISLKHLNTYISILRNMKILNGKMINKPFQIYPNGTYELNFKFIISHE